MRRYPAVDLGNLRAYDRMRLEAGQRGARLLAELRPPGDQAASFARFVANEREITRMLIRVVAADNRGEDQKVLWSRFDALIDNRNSSAPSLRIPACDGQLPPGQAADAIQAVRAWRLTREAGEACGTLVTQQYLLFIWPYEPDPMAACVALLNWRINHPQGITHDIDVREVTGIEHISGSVRFVDIGGCCAGHAYEAMVSFEDGAWKVQTYYDDK
jgi:hypothetical protein